MSAAELATVAGAVLLASTVQATSGFGFGLLAVPLMALAVSAREAVVVSTLLGISVSSWQAWSGRAEAVRPLVRRMVISAYAGMPIGLLVFLVVSDATLRIALGASVLVAVALIALRINLTRSGPLLDVGAGFLSGVLNTSLSTNGPPLVFVLQARHLDPRAFRATITTVFAISNVGGIALFVAAGEVGRDGLVAVALAIPALLAGQVVGTRLRRHVDGDRFRTLVIVLLVVAALSAIASAS